MSWNLLITFFSVYGASAFAEIENGSGDSSNAIKTCDSGWYSFGNMCYKAEKDERTWSQAERQCMEYGGHLVSIHNEELQEFLLSYLLMEARKNLWIGLHDQIMESSYIWSDGSSFDYRRWAPLEPTGSANHHEDCVELFYLFPAETRLGKWNDVDCNQKRSFICQKERTSIDNPLDSKYCSSNNEGWKFQDSCFNIVEDKLSWDQAENFCRTHYSGHLVTVKDITVSIFLDYFLKDFHQDVWIGLKLEESSPQKWSSGWFVSYKNWGHEISFNENMCALRLMGSKWSIDFCHRKLAFICEASSVAPPTLTPSVKGSTCPEKSEDWKDLGGDFCYFFETKKSLTWPEANLNCMQRGGYLASIHSPEESYVIQPFLEQSSRVHIGLYRQLQQPNEQREQSIRAHGDPGVIVIGRDYVLRHGVPLRFKRQVSDSNFVWADGSERSYTNWGENQPNKGDENCVDMFSSDMDWHDFSCGEKVGYICSVRKVTPTEISQNGNESSSSISSMMKADQNENSKICTRYSMFIAVICILLCILLLMLVFNVYYFKSIVKVWFERKWASVLTSQKHEDDQKPNSCSTKCSLQDSYVRMDSIL